MKTFMVIVHVFRGMALEAVESILLAVLVAASLVAVESERLTRAVLGFLVFTIALGAIFIFLNAAYLGLLVLLIYAGAAIALLLMVIMLTRGSEEG